MQPNRILALFCAIVGAMLLVSCSGGGGGDSAGVSGRVFDAVTGAPVAGARVVCPGGTSTATTDGSGIYRFSGESGSATGMFGAWKGVSYQFLLLDNVTVSSAGSPVYDIALIPNNTAGYATYNIFGSLPGVAAANGAVFVRVYNSSGGVSDTGYSGVPVPTGASTYAATVKTGGGDCLVWIVYDTDSGSSSDDAINCYFDHVAIGAGANTFNIPAPGVSNLTVTGGIPGQDFPVQCLMTPTWGPVGYLGGLAPFGAAGKAIWMRNQSNYPVVWTNMNVVGSFRQGALSAPVAQASTVTLPTLPGSSYDPGSQGGVMSWSPGSATLSFVAVSGASDYAINVADVGPAHQGTIMTTRTMLDLPFDLCSEVLDQLGAGAWNATLRPEHTSVSDFSVLLPLLKYNSSNGPQGYQNVQFSSAENGYTTAAIFP